MNLHKIESQFAPAAIGPYSQAIVAGNILYVSGQIPLDPATNGIVEGGISAQTRRVLENLKSVVEAAGGQMSNIVKITIYLTDMKQFAIVNEIYGTYFSTPYPARACVEVSALPKGVEIEMEAIAHLN